MDDTNILINNTKHQFFRISDVEKHFFTLNLNEVQDFNELIEQYSGLLDEIIEIGLTPVYERIFGDNTQTGALYKVKQEKFKNIYPTGFVNYETISGAPLSSIFVYAVKINNEDTVSVSSISDKAVKLRIKDVEHFYFLGNEKKSVEEDPFEGVFMYLDKCLRTNSLSSDSIVRTWFYVRSIEEYYPKFNEERRHFFDRNNITYSNQASNLPSSTCIGALVSENELIHSDMYCLRQTKNTFKVGRMYNQNQNEANGTTYKFQPTFARATEIIGPEHIEIQVSGTASINDKGESIHLNNPYDQIQTTIKHVEHLLGQHSMKFEDLIQSTCFFKNKDYYDDFVKVLKDMKIPMFSSTFVVGDVCRDELLFELDGIALKIK